MLKTTITFLFFISVCTLNAQDIFDIARKGSVNQISELYKKNPKSINQKDKRGYDPLTLACYSGNTEVVKFLVAKVDNINGESKFGTPLMAAVYKKDLAIVTILLAHKVNVNATDKNGVSALHYATMFNDTKMAKKLINAGAKTDLKDNNGKTPYDYIQSYKNEEIITLINKKQ